MAGLGLLSAAVLAAPAQFRYSAPVQVDRPAAFVQLALPPAAYAHSQRSGLEDLRLVDADGERVPFALLQPRAAAQRDKELLRDVVAYALPRRPAPGAAWASPVEVVVQGDRLSVRRLGGGTQAAPDPQSPGWLFDLGERRSDDPPPKSLRLQWTAPAEFSATYSFESSDDLHQWRPGGQGQLLALGTLTQPSVPLPSGVGRFVRLTWSDPGSAPAISAARQVADETQQQVLDPPTRLGFSGVPDGRGLRFDLGAVLPLVEVDLQWSAGTHLAPLRIQGRDAEDAPWREIAPAVFYRLERPDGASVSPAIALQARQRYLRLLPDERAAALEPGLARLVVQAPLASLVFAAQGQPPFRLLAGSPDAPGGALPVATLVPALDDERSRFGRASLGPWSENADVAQRREADRRRAALRPWLLWAVLLVGVAGLGFMVWRLLRNAPSA